MDEAHVKRINEIKRYFKAYVCLSKSLIDFTNLKDNLTVLPPEICSSLYVSGTINYCCMFLDGSDQIKTKNLNLIKDFKTIHNQLILERNKLIAHHDKEYNDCPLQIGSGAIKESMDDDSPEKFFIAFQNLRYFSSHYPDDINDLLTLINHTNSVLVHVKSHIDGLIDQNFKDEKFAKDWHLKHRKESKYEKATEKKFPDIPIQEPVISEIIRNKKIVLLPTELSYKDEKYIKSTPIRKPI